MKLALALEIATAACIVACVATGCSPPPEPTTPAGEARRYVTRRTLEPDKLASIWLLTRFVEPAATFEFVDDSAPLDGGIPFDTPEAEFRRYAAMSCFESIAKKHAIRHPGVARLGELIHDIEVNYWGPKRFPESTVLQGRLVAVIEAHTNDIPICIRKSAAVLDEALREVESTSGAAKTGTPR